MTRTDAFARDMVLELNKRRGSGTWKCGWKPEDKGRAAVDVGWEPRRKNGRLVLIEVELRRGAPVENVIKIWRWIADGDIQRKVVLIQAFSKYYGRNTRHRARAQFIGERMKKACGMTYVPLDIPYKPYKHGKTGAGRRATHAKNLARRVLQYLANA